MQSLTDYNDIVKEMIFYFSERIQKARSFGISDIVIDPGFGFCQNIGTELRSVKKWNYFRKFRITIISRSFQKIDDL